MYLSILLSVDIFALFPVFTIINNASVNILVHILWTYIPILIGCVSRRDLYVYIYIIFFFFESAQAEEGQRERERERENPKQAFCPVQKDMGLDPTTMRSWPEPKSRVRRSASWATQALEEGSVRFTLKSAVYETSRYFISVPKLVFCLSF